MDSVSHDRRSLPARSAPRGAHLLASLASLAALAALVACNGDDTATSMSATDSGATDPSATATATATMTGATDSGATDSGATDSGATDSGTTDPGTTDPGTTGPGTTTEAPTTSETDTDTGDTETDTGEVCPEGQILCEDGEAKTCDGRGGFSEASPCSDACADGVGCVLCIPDSYTCDDQANSLKCTESGDAWEPYETCDDLQGLSCEVNSGQCAGACTKSALGLNYIGCNYFPTLTPQFPGYQQNPHQFAVAVSNTSGAMATIHVTRDDNIIAMETVAPGTVETIALPWDNALTAMDGTTTLHAAGAYRLRSDQPVTVYQYNPLAATVTNDASLLLPTNSWTGSYLVAAWQHWDQVNRSGFVAVVAEGDETTVTLQPSATGNKLQAGAGINNDGTGTALLQEGDVLMLRTATGGDLTGTIITADRPIQVIGGHPCTNVPLGISACDHLEESMFPLETLATDYFVVPPAQVPNDNLEKAQIIRLIAAEADTNLVFEPDQNVAKNLVNAGDFIEIPTTQAAFRVKSDKRIAISQYMVGQSAGFGTSDPAMLMSVATEQYRENYLFHAPPSWSANYVDIIAPSGASLTVDGDAIVAPLTPIGDTGYGYIHVKLSNAGDGTHTVNADQKVGISVYGVLSFGSYWYAGGLDLMPIPQ